MYELSHIITSAEAYEHLNEVHDNYCTYVTGQRFSEDV